MNKEEVQLLKLQKKYEKDVYRFYAVYAQWTGARYAFSENSKGNLKGKETEDFVMGVVIRDAATGKLRAPTEDDNLDHLLDQDNKTMKNYTLHPIKNATKRAMWW